MYLDMYFLFGFMYPIKEYIGCFEIKPTDIATDRTSIPDNDVLMCSLFCKEREFNTNTVILLKKDACYCLPYSTLIAQTKRSDSSMNENLNRRCSEPCPGDNTDQCGGSNYFSVYNITENKIKEDGKRIGTNCSQIPLTWRQELRTCLKSGASFKILTSSGESYHIDPVAVNISDFRYSFVKLSFVWNTRPESKYDYKCLGLRLEEKKKFKLLPINCTEKRKALCHKVSDEDSTEDLNGLWTQHSTLQSNPYTTVFNVSEVNHTWDRASDTCVDGWTLSGKRMFNSCRSDSCQTINANKMLPNIKKKHPFLWIDGYVVRSPVMEYYECLDLTDLQSTVNAVQNMNTLNHNGVEKCSLFCKQDKYLKDRDYILLQNDTCYCVRYRTLAQWNTQGNIQKVSSKSCDTRCDGDKFDRCGGRKTCFQRIKLIGLPISDEIEETVFFTVSTSSNSNRNRISCKERLSFKCDSHDIR
ncbi:unnamed protein product [Mytilus edulis]|uniref:WSC domain-containing protein n=1 Tax=Mytilus edulis TaxID=6550 RepID=A0A8S3S2P1_MYTED|nr:unnamed protein product [Mytilus edulis]